MLTGHYCPETILYANVADGICIKNTIDITGMSPKLIEI